jgi:hypothetical protein
VTFYAWLQSEQSSRYAFLLRMYDQLRIPKNSNKLCKLLRYLDSKKSNHEYHGRARYHLKVAHRAYRQSLKLESEIEKGVEIPRGKEPLFEVIAELETQNVHVDRPGDEYYAHLKRTGDVTFTINFDSAENGFDELCRFYFDSYVQELTGIPKPAYHRWNRVYQRWGFKHRDKCARCNSRIELVRLMLGQLVICRDTEACEERETFELNTRLCPECRQPHGKNQYMNFPILCDVCFTKNLGGIPLAKTHEQD